MAAAFTFGVAAAEIDFTYAGEPYSSFGLRKKEAYDVAIGLTDPGFKGNQIKGIAVALPSEGISDVRFWLSSSLQTHMVDGKKQNLADIGTYTATVEDGVAWVTLDEPYEITEEGVYAGYSFNVDELTDATMYPVYVGAGGNPDGLYMRSEKTYRAWKTFSEDYSLSSTLTVALITPDYENAVGISEVRTTRAKIGEESCIDVVVCNHGTSQVESVGYTYEADGKTGEGECTLATPLSADYNSQALVSLPMPAFDSKGQKQVSFTITKVNGQENQELNPSGSGVINVLSVVPVHRAVMEEYTGTWCGYCARGYAALEYLNKHYPDNFIALAYHNKDQMAIMSSYPASISGFPGATVDRGDVVDPYHGYSAVEFGIEKIWLSRCEEISPAAIDVEAEWLDDDNIAVTANVTFVEEPDDNYLLAYYLVEDRMSGTTSSWMQANYFGGDHKIEYIEEMDRFINGDKYVLGLEFDDVVVMTSNMYGEPGSLDGVEFDVPYSHTYEFNAVSEAPNIQGNPVVLDKSWLRAVALIIDKTTGRIVNAAKTGYIHGASVDGMEHEANMSSVEYYDLNGKRVGDSYKGICVKVSRLADGGTQTSKIVK